MDRRQALMYFGFALLLGAALWSSLTQPNPFIVRASTPTHLPTQPTSKSITLTPYLYTILIPQDWSARYTEKYFHYQNGQVRKCLTYRIESPAEMAVIIFDPFCGEGGDIFDDCPLDMRIIGSLANGKTVGRFSHDGLMYSEVSNGDCGCHVWVGKEPYRITAYYQGPESEWPHYLDTLDRIVLSIQETP